MATKTTKTVAAKTEVIAQPATPVVDDATMALLKEAHDQYNDLRLAMAKAKAAELAKAHGKGAAVGIAVGAALALLFS